MNKQKRVVIYMPASDYLELRARLLQRGGKTVSGWFRSLVKKILSSDNQNGLLTNGIEDEDFEE